MVMYRKIFPSYDWDQDVCFVNQIVNYPKIVGANAAGFIKNVPNEEIKSSDRAIARWINENMSSCSCYVLFVGEKTYQSKWVLYEMDLAREKGLGRLIIYLDRMTDPLGRVCKLGIDPYSYHERYCKDYSPSAYEIKAYHWKDFKDPYKELPSWIEDACRRANK